MPRLHSARKSALKSVRKGAFALGVALPLLAGAAWAQTPAPASPAPAAAAPADPAKVIARVNGMDITQGDLAIAASDPALQLPDIPDAQKLDLLAGYLIDLKLGAKAAEAAKVADAPDFARKLAYNQDKTLLDEYLNQAAKKAVTPEAARKLYDETVKSMTPESEVRARHILVDSEDEAKKAAQRVKGGEDFAKVAGELSKDPGSKTDGGDLGFFTKDRMVEAFADAAFKMEPGQVSEPVKSQFGWHVIKVEEKRSKPVPAFEEMQAQVNTYLERKAQQDLIMSLRKDAKIERLDASGNLVEQKADAPKP
jgi:peptidyl-prolyl cis-trans isomerase C